MRINIINEEMATDKNVSIVVFCVLTGERVCSILVVILCYSFNYVERFWVLRVATYMNNYEQNSLNGIILLTLIMGIVDTCLWQLNKLKYHWLLIGA